MKTKLTASSVILTLASIVLNVCIFLIDVDMENYMPFLIGVNFTLVLTCIALFLIIMRIIYKVSSINDKKTKLVTIIVTVIILVIGCVSTFTSAFGTYESFSESEVYSNENLYELLKDNLPYKHEKFGGCAFSADKYGKNQLIKIQQPGFENGYEVVYYKTNNIYLSKRFALQYNPGFADLFIFGSNITPTDSYTIRRDGKNVHIYVDNTTAFYKDYAIIISNAFDSMYFELTNVRSDEITIENFIDEAINQFNSLKKVDFNSEINWE